MTITNGYCTLSEFKQWLTAAGQTISADVGDDSVIESIIEASSRFIDGECVRHFYKSSADETRYYTATESTYVRPDDLVSVTTIYTDDGSREYADTWTTDDFDLWPYNAAADGRPYVKIVTAPYSNYWFYPGVAKGVKITGIFGWPSVPEPIREACILITLSTYKRRFGENLSSVSTVTGGGVVITPQDVPAGAWAKINPYRRRL
jgi:hypothetical protein